MKVKNDFSSGACGKSNPSGHDRHRQERTTRLRPWSMKRVKIGSAIPTYALYITHTALHPTDLSPFAAILPISRNEMNQLLTGLAAVKVMLRLVRSCDRMSSS